MRSGRVRGFGCSWPPGPLRGGRSARGPICAGADLRAPEVSLEPGAWSLAVGSMAETREDAEVPGASSPIPRGEDFLGARDHRQAGQLPRSKGCVATQQARRATCPPARAIILPRALRTFLVLVSSWRSGA